MNSGIEVTDMLKGLFGKKTENPFVGLRPYEADEGHLFFGRGIQIKSLLERLHTSRFLSVVGSSGCGKSSLIRAGVIPKLQGGFLTQERDCWLIAIMRPSGKPLDCFAASLKETFQNCKELSSDPFFQNLTAHTLLQSGATQFIEKMKTLFCNNRFNLLILVDQFEELFTYKVHSEAHKNENVFFVNLLLNLAAARELPVYSIITMRSDYIGHCNSFFGLPELLNETQYLVPKLKWQQVREVIELPIKLCGQQINPGLLDLLTNDSDKEVDQLPVLQHCLMRTYQNWINAGRKGDIDFVHYDKTGKLKGALCQHADEVYNTLDGSQKEIAKYLFKAITEFNTEYEPVRLPRKFKNIVEICDAVQGSAAEKVLAVINVFRKKTCAFLTPPESVTDITGETIIDISHESLLRQWDILKDDKLKGAAKDGWMIEEQRSADKLYWLSECVLAEEKEYLGRLGVADAEKWLLKQKPNAAWAKRYVNNLDDIKQFIKTSKKKSQTKNLLFIGSTCLTAVALIVAVYFIARANTAKAEANEQKALIHAASAKATLDAANAKAILDAANAKAILDAANAKAILDAANAKAKLDAANAQARLAAADAKAEMEKANAKAAQAKTEAMAEAILQVSALVRNLTQDEFYRSDLLDVDKRNRYLDSLVALKYGESPDSVAFEKLRSDLNNMAEIKYLVQTDPNVALLKAQQVYDSSESKLADSLLLDVANTNLFYSKRLGVPKKTLEAKQTPVAISKSRKSFAFKDADTVRLYNVNNKELSFMKNIILKNLNEDTTNLNYNYYSIPALTFTDDYHLLVFTNNNDIYRIDTNGVTSSINITDLLSGNDSVQYSLSRKHYTSAISADGETLALDYNDYNVILLKINEKNSNPQIIRLDRLDGYVDNIYTSADGKNIIIRQGIKYKMYDAVTNRRLDVLNDSTSYANFSDDGKYILEQKLNDSIYMYSLESGKTEKLNLSLQEKVSSITISPDQQKMIIKSGSSDYPNKVYYFEKDNSFASLNYKSTQKQFPYFKYSNIFFTGSDDLMDMTNDLYNYNQYIRIWKDYGKVTHTTLPVVLKEIPTLTYDEKLKAGFIKYEDIEYSGDEATLLKSAEYYNSTEFYDSSSLLKAQELYQKLLTITTSSENKQNYLTKLTTINADLFAIDSNWRRRAAGLKKIISYREELVNQFPDSNYYKTGLSSNYWNLSWCQVFIDEYDGAVYSAKRGYALDTINNGIITNLALGYLLSGQCEKANSVYETYKDKTYLTSEKKFTNAFLEDFNDLEKAGIITPGKKEIYAHVQKVTDYLNDKTKTLDCK